MNKPVLGLLLGGFLGIFDGLTAWFTPAARAGLAGIVIGSTIKGIITGVCIGYFCEKGAFAWAGNCIRAGSGNVSCLPGGSDAARVLFRNHAPGQHSGCHRRLRDATIQSRRSHLSRATRYQHPRASTVNTVDVNPVGAEKYETPFATDVFSTTNPPCIPDNCLKMHDSIFEEMSVKFFRFSFEATAFQVYK
jgi:hypothetical protein